MRLNINNYGLTYAVDFEIHIFILFEKKNGDCEETKDIVKLIQSNSVLLFLFHVISYCGLLYFFSLFVRCYPMSYCMAWHSLYNTCHWNANQQQIWLMVSLKVRFSFFSSLLLLLSPLPPTTTTLLASFSNWLL